MKRIFLVLFCLLALPVMASHIVGGEFELIYLSKNNYRLNLIYYFDLKNNTFNGDDPENAQPELSEPTITVGIFRKSDNAFIRYVVLTFVSRTHVSYTQPDCSHGEIKTDKLLYSADIVLEDENFSDPSGYYVAWQRCCRNYNIINIVSDEPAPGQIDFPDAAGQTFYLEFPPVVKNGKPFVNSTPRLFPPLNDYACPGKLYYADFAGTDDDGDSLVYSLSVPLSTPTSEASPATQPGPYPDVKWQSPFSFTNITGGKPDLKISKDGFLTVTPKTQGLFVFAVKCEEYRKRKKIGEVRRDFQMLVVDGCSVSAPPKILGKKLADATFTYDNVMNVSFAGTVDNEDRCIQVRVSDPDALRADNNFQENISIRAIALNFKKDISDILPEVTTATLHNNETKTFQICFDNCPPIEGPFQIGIVAYDDACSLPLSDTLKVNVTIDPPANNNAKFTSVNSQPAADVNKTVQPGVEDQLTWEIEATDADGDLMDIFMFSDDGFNMADYGMSLIVHPQIGNAIQATFTWDPKCKVYDFSDRTEFRFSLLVEDEDQCDFDHPDILSFDLKIKLLGDNKPIISTDLAPDEVQSGVTRKIYETLAFNVFGNDVDGDELQLTMQGIDFDPTEYNVGFNLLGNNQPDASSNPVAANFNWLLSCDQIDLRKRSKFDFRFIVIDNKNYCKYYRADTLVVEVIALPPDNSKPIITVTNINPELPFENNHQTLEVDQHIALALTATDKNINPQDRIKIQLTEATGNVSPSGYAFTPAEGIAFAETTFLWNPECSIFKNGSFENNYTFSFSVTDDRCLNTKADTVDVTFTIKDKDAGTAQFIPPNFFTPNGDSKNDFFAMVKEDPDTHELMNILPIDNCAGRFVKIDILNRWGRVVYTSGDRNFRWYPGNEASGIYFYTLKYSDKDYKGSITVRD
jgi:hypothetical protein